MIALFFNIGGALNDKMHLTLGQRGALRHGQFEDMDLII
ncbi:hypothetical protein PMIT1320_00640 [Prochlorococcus marinus str. MIT 1320]|nr:hypothetical protein PMIT1320_00640 [Prochlorococcus marinus str. MIT 1320]